MSNQKANNDGAISSARTAECTSTDERWADIEGHEGTHQVSTLGRVRSLDRSITPEGRPYSFPAKGRILTPTICENKHTQIRLSRNGRRTQYLLRDLVAVAFVFGRNEGFIVIQKDGDKHNCRADNLEWKKNRK